MAVASRFDTISRQMVAYTDMGRREARFYDAVAAGLPIRTPAPIWSAWSAWSAWSNDDPNQYFMLLEDLSRSGSTFPTPGENDALQTAEGMIETLAKLHGRYWESPRFERDLSWIEAPMRASIGPQLIEEGLKQFGDRMPAEFHALAELYLDHNEAVCDLLDSGPQTLTHGDCHIGNTFLDYGEVGLLDWACTCRSPGIRDVSYYLCNSVPTSERRDHESALLQRYLEGLESERGALVPYRDRPKRNDPRDTLIDIFLFHRRRL
jgi:aminoglycoside/choline kinase family phosphotransferase